MASIGRKAKVTLIQPEVEHGPGVGDFRNVVRLLEEGISIGRRLVPRCFDDRGRLRPGIYRESAGDIPVEPERPAPSRTPWGFRHGTTQQEV